MSEKNKGQQEENRETGKAIAPVQAAVQESRVSEKVTGQVLVYVGPSFKGAIRGTVYNNGLPDVLKEVIKEKPVIGELLVPISELPLANRELMDADSARNRIFRIANDYFRKGE